jgi:trans-2,3-dihydro-3-hydroxyanthranilate isomerase
MADGRLGDRSRAALAGSTIEQLIELRYRIVDVFSERPLEGNALCVVLDPAPPPVMQAIAREVNLSETTFPVVTGPDSYDVRIFTPASELPFAGHPTLGTAWVLGAQRWEQTSPGATVEVTADADGASMQAPAPTFTEVYPRDVALALGLPEAAVPHAFVGEAGGVRHLFVPTDHAIDALDPDLAAIGAVGRSLRVTTIYPLTRIDDRTLEGRAFGPHSGIVEDPGTGSAAGPAAVLARRLWSTEESITIRQGHAMGRPCRITVDVSGEKPVVGGRVTASAEGRFTL